MEEKQYEYRGLAYKMEAIDGEFRFHIPYRNFTSEWDRIWGIGREKKDPLAWNRSTWLGTNLLGQAITEARGIMKKG